MSKKMRKVLLRIPNDNHDEENKAISFDEYQTFAISTADPCAHDPLYLSVGLCEEAGEAAGKVKKTIRDKKRKF